MTTAPDLPLPAPPAAVPAQPYIDRTIPAPAYPAEPDRAPLVLVPAPSAEPAPSDDIVDFDDALRAAFPRLHRYATRRLGDAHEAEEVVQEALLRAFQHRAALRTEDDLMAWLTVVTGRLVIDRLRVRGRTTPVAELPAGSRAGRDTADVVVARDEARIALDALEAMPSRQAAVLWAREVEGLSYDEIGNRYALSEPTVRSLLHRARRTLRREYTVRGGTLPSLGLVALAPWLRGLRAASRIRDIARKGGLATATAATGLAVATIAPLWSAPAPSHARAVPLQHIAAKAETAAAPTAHRVADRLLTTTRVDAPAEPSTSHPSRLQLSRLPRACTAKHGYGVGCGAPQTPTLYLQLPNNKEIGISASSLSPISCTSLPTTPVTHCEPSDRKP